MYGITVAFDGEFSLKALPSRGSQPMSKRAVAGESREAVHQCVGIVGFGKEAGLIVEDNIPNAGNIGRYHWKTAGHRFDGDKPLGLPPRRENKYIALPESLPLLLAVERPVAADSHMATWGC